MKRLEWKHTGSGTYVAEGREYSYQIDGIGDDNRVMQMRQPGGQIIREATMRPLGAAMARAQVWEKLA